VRMRRPAGMAYAAVAWLLLAAVIVQFFLAGLGAFGGGFLAHVVFAWLIAIVIVLLVIVSFAARVPWRMTGLAGLLVLLWAVQLVLAHTGVSYISALHALNALAMLGVSGARGFISAPVTEPAPGAQDAATASTPR